MIRNRSKRNGASQREDRPDFYLFIDAMTYKYHSLIILSLIALNLLVYFVLLTELKLKEVTHLFRAFIVG